MDPKYVKYIPTVYLLLKGRLDDSDVDFVAYMRRKLPDITEDDAAQLDRIIAKYFWPSPQGPRR